MAAVSLFTPTKQSILEIHVIGGGLQWQIPLLGGCDLITVKGFVLWIPLAGWKVTLGYCFSFIYQGRF